MINKKTDELSHEVFIQRTGRSILHIQPHKIDHKTRILERGDVCGEYAILSGKHRDTVKCLTWSEFYVLDINDLIAVLRENYLDPKALNRAYTSIKSVLRKTLRKATSRKVKFKAAMLDENVEFIHEFSPDAVGSTIHSPNPHATLDPTNNIYYPSRTTPKVLTPNGQHVKYLPTKLPTSDLDALSPSPPMVNAQQLKSQKSFDFPGFPLTKRMTTARSSEYNDPTPKSVIRSDSARSTLQKMRTQSSRRLLKTFSGLLAREDSAERHDMVMKKPNAFAMDVKKLDTTHRDFEYSDHEESHFHRDLPTGIDAHGWSGGNIEMSGTGGHHHSKYRKHKGGASSANTTRARGGKFGGKRRIQKQATRRGAAVAVKGNVHHHHAMNAHGMKMREKFTAMLSEISDEHDHHQDMMMLNDHLSPDITAPTAPINDIEFHSQSSRNFEEDEADDEYDLEEKLDLTNMNSINTNNMSNHRVSRRKSSTTIGTIQTQTHDYRKPHVIEMTPGSMNDRIYHVGNHQSQLKSAGSYDANVGNVPSLQSPTHSMNQHHLYGPNSVPQHRKSLTAKTTSSKNHHHRHPTPPMGVYVPPQSTPAALDVIQSNQELIKMSDNVSSNELPDNVNIYNDLDDDINNKQNRNNINDKQRQRTNNMMEKAVVSALDALNGETTTSADDSKNQLMPIIKTSNGSNDDNGSNNKLKKDGDTGSDSFIYSITNQNMLPDFNKNVTD